MSVGELLESLRLIEHTLQQVRGHLAVSRTALTEAEAALVRLDPEHPDTVVPPGLRRAQEHVERTEALVNGVIENLRSFAARL